MAGSVVEMSWSENLARSMEEIAKREKTFWRRNGNIAKFYGQSMGYDWSCRAKVTTSCLYYLSS